MRGVHIKQVDLNLVPALGVLLDERQVSRAAHRMQLSQPAMSRVLARLRRQFDDELLVRGLHGYQLTPRAEDLHSQLLDVIAGLEHLFAAQEFDPRTAQHDFRLVGTDYAVLSFGPALFAHLLTHSPGSSLCFENWSPVTFDALDAGSTDIVFYGAPGPTNLQHEILFTDTFECLVAADHELAAKERLGLSDYLAWPHLVISVDGRQPAIDDPLDRLGIQRRAGLTIPFHSAAAAAVQGTGLIATVPSRMLRTDSIPVGTARVGAPPEVEKLPYSMIWSPRVTDDPAHSWLRQAIRVSCRQSADV